MPLVTADEADARDRAAIRRMVLPEGYMVCPGYPVDHFCLTMIPWTHRYCRFCEGTKALEMAAIVRGSPSIPSVGEIMEDVIPTPVKVCPCGGDSEAPYHEMSLSHLTWVNNAAR